MRTIGASRWTTLTWGLRTDADFILTASGSDYTLSQEQVQRVLATPEVIYQTDPERHILWVSPDVNEVLGYSPLDLLGRRYSDVLDSARAPMNPAWRAAARVALASGNRVYYEATADRFGGGIEPIAGFVYPHFASDGTIAGLQVTLSRISTVQAVTESAESVRTILEETAGHGVPDTVREELSTFLAALAAGDAAGLLLCATDDGEVTAAPYQATPTSDVIETVIGQAMGPRKVEYARLRAVADAVRDGGAIVMKVPAVSDQPVKIRTYGHSARITIEDTA